MNENLDKLCFGELSSVLYRQYQQYINRAMKPYGVNYAECEYLVKIPDGKVVTQTYIAEHLFCDNAVVTRSLKSLEKKALVTRCESPHDKRAVLVSLTEAGERAKQAGLMMRRNWRKQMMLNVTAEEETEIMDSLREMAVQALSAAKSDKMEEA